MKVLIVLDHPTQFDVPVFRLGKNFIDVIYTSTNNLQNVYDPELQRKVSWIGNSLEGYTYAVLPKRNKIRWLLGKIKNTKYDLIITNGYFNIYLATVIVLGRIYCRRNSLRLDSVPFNNQSKLKKVTKFLTYSMLKLFVEYYFVVGKLSKDFVIKQGVDERKISLYGYVSNDRFFKDQIFSNKNNLTQLKKKYCVPSDKLIILCVSKHNLREAPVDTILAFSKIERKDLHLLIVGDGPMHSQLIELAKKNNISEITFAGYVEYNLLSEVYFISNLFIHDSHNEPWGVSVQEALSCGIPVIASDKVGSSYDLVKNGVNGYVFMAGDQVTLQRLIEQAAELDRSLAIAETDKILLDWTYEGIIYNIKKVATSSV